MDKSGARGTPLCEATNPNSFTKHPEHLNSKYPPHPHSTSTLLFPFSLPKPKPTTMSRWGNIKAKVSEISDATYWTELKTDEGDVYFYNTHTEETAWERPAAMNLQHASVEETKSKGKEVHGIAGDLKPLQKFRNKKEYDNRNHDHLKFKSTQASLVGHEKVKFSDFCYRIVPAQHGNPLSIEPARLMLTSHAVYDFDIGQAPGSRLKPQRRLPLLAIKQIGIHQTQPTIFFRLNGEKQRHAIRYYNPRKDMIVNLMLRTYAVSTKLGLRKKFVKDEIPHSIKKLADDTKKLLARGNGGLFGLVGQAQAGKVKGVCILC